MESLAVQPAGGFAAHTLVLQTERARQFIDITDDIVDRVESLGIRFGLAVVASRHTTGAIVVNEHEPLLLGDLDRLLNELAPENGEYAHNGVPCGKGERPNGHSHCQSLLLSASASVPIVDGQLSLGRYQRVFFVELDCPRQRQVSLVFLGA